MLVTEVFCSMIVWPHWNHWDCFYRKAEPLKEDTSKWSSSSAVRRRASRITRTCSLLIPAHFDFFRRALQFGGDDCHIQIDWWNILPSTSARNRCFETTKLFVLPDLKLLKCQFISQTPPWWWQGYLKLSEGIVHILGPIIMNVMMEKYLQFCLWSRWCICHCKTHNMYNITCRVRLIYVADVPLSISVVDLSYNRKEAHFT